ncbi:hypothetical protein MTR_4g017125 [Medicago truncatula]|uniref:Uncharacterized protein n=1 Tax=Medicago truncatula TaxID=3880 RepID=A0A072UGX2_MEDTR|nr:hypothetical protein MTR_4g017125 [Medicago truncatula]
MKNVMNPDEDHHEHNNILMFIRDQNVCPEFQVKACGTQDTWHNTIGHPTTSLPLWVEHLTVYEEKIQKEVMSKPASQSAYHICNNVGYLKSKIPLKKKMQRWHSEMSLKKKSTHE